MPTFSGYRVQGKENLGQLNSDSLKALARLATLGNKVWCLSPRGLLPSDSGSLVSYFQFLLVDRLVIHFLLSYLHLELGTSNRQIRLFRGKMNYLVWNWNLKVS